MLMMPSVTLIPRFLLFKNLHLTDVLAADHPCWFGGTAMQDLDAAVLREHPARARTRRGSTGSGVLGDPLADPRPAATPVLVALGILELAYFWNDLLGPRSTPRRTRRCRSRSASSRTPNALLVQLLALLAHRPDGLPIALLFLTSAPVPTGLSFSSGLGAWRSTG
jgi:hypothetical protein